MKRVAICFSGQLRTWRKVFETWKLIVDDTLSDANVDYFFHIFKENTIPKIGVSQIDLELLDNPKTELKDICTIFKPKKFLIESQKTFVDSLDRNEYVNPYICQYYSMKKVSELKQEYEKENNFTYNIVVKARYDLFFKFHTVDIDSEIETNTLYGYNPTYDNNGNLNRITDLFFYSDSKTFDFLSDYYLNIKTLPEKFRNYSVEPEFAWFQYLIQNNIKIKEHHWDIKVMRNFRNEIKNKDLSYEMI